jgi:hypothetical protein
MQRSKQCRQNVVRAAFEDELRTALLAKVAREWWQSKQARRYG